MPDMTKPRKRKNSAEGIINPQQKAVADIISSKLENITQKDFCKITGCKISTLANLFRPDYGKAPTPRILKQLSQIADSEDRRIELYTQLMIAAGKGKDLAKYPYDDKSTTAFASENDLLHKALMNIMLKINNMPYQTEVKIEEAIIKEDSALRKDITVYFNEDSCIDTWEFIICDRETPSLSIKDFLWKVLTMYMATPNNKYSLVTSNIDVVNYCKKLDIPAVNSFLSVVYFDGNEIIEFPISTSASGNPVTL